MKKFEGKREKEKERASREERWTCAVVHICLWPHVDVLRFENKTNALDDDLIATDCRKKKTELIYSGKKRCFPLSQQLLHLHRCFCNLMESLRHGVLPTIQRDQSCLVLLLFQLLKVFAKYPEENEPEKRSLVVFYRGDRISKLNFGIVDRYCSLQIAVHSRSTLACSCFNTLLARRTSKNFRRSLMPKRLSYESDR